MRVTLISIVLGAGLGACAPTAPTMNPQPQLNPSLSTGAGPDEVAAWPRMDLEAAEVLGGGKYETATFALG